MTAPDGIVLDAALAAVVPEGARCELELGEGPSVLVGDGCAAPGDILTHVGGRPVAEIVADVDTLREIVSELAHDGMFTTAAELAAIAERLMDPALVNAWHAQHDRSGS